jgi:hypothetical protein
MEIILHGTQYREMYGKLREAEGKEGGIGDPENNFSDW